MQLVIDNRSYITTIESTQHSETSQATHMKTGNTKNVFLELQQPMNNNNKHVNDSLFTDVCSILDKYTDSIIIPPAGYAIVHRRTHRVRASTLSTVMQNYVRVPEVSVNPARDEFSA